MTSNMEISVIEKLEHWTKVRDKIEKGDFLDRELFDFGCECAAEFLRVNFVGPVKPPDWLTGQWTDQECQDFARQNLSLKGDVVPIDCLVSRHCQLPVLLWLAVEIIVKNGDSQRNADINFLEWKLRVLALWQRCADELNSEVKEEGYETLQLIMTNEQDDQIGDKMKQSQLHMQCCMFSLMYRDVSTARTHLEQALVCAGVEVELGGALGKRTHFQQKLVAQLRVHVNSDRHQNEERADSVLPVCVSLRDDTMLENVEFAENNDAVHCSRLQQALILTTSIFNAQASARDDLFCEEQTALVNEILSNNLDWSMTMCALYMRTNLEAMQRRYVERALAQTEEMIKTIELCKSCPFVSCYGWLLKAMTPVWQLKLLHCRLLISLGCVSEALAIYARLKDYDGMVACYKALGLKEQAIALLKDMLEQEGDEPRLLCSLADVTEDVCLYEKAWFVSQGTYARAMYSLGKLYIDRKRLEEGYSCLEKALKLLPLRWDAWFSLGYCAMKLERFQEAAKAFHRCVSIEPEHAESWNNLAAAYLHLNQKHRALPILQEALKFSHGDPRLCENLLTVATDIGKVKEAVRAYHSLLDINPQFIDAHILHVLVQQAKESSVVDELRKLFGRVSSRGCSIAGVWIDYATLYDANDNIDAIDKRLSFLQKAHAQFLRDTQLENNAEEFLNFVLNAENIGQSQLKKIEIDTAHEGTVNVDSVKSSARMLISGVLSRYRKRCDIIVQSDDKLESVIHRLEELVKQFE